MATGAGTAIFVAGWCFAFDSRIERLALSLGGEPQDVLAHSMPRLDLLRELGEPGAYRSGFWGIVRIGPGTREPRELPLKLHADLRCGGTVTHELTRFQVRRELPSVDLGRAGNADPPVGAMPAPTGGGDGSDDGALIAICMATHNPPEDLLRRQLDSIRAQTHPDWVCCISDDRSRPDAYARLREAVGDDPRFVLARSEQRLGFYRNFERALTMAPAQAAFVALADQDDDWRPGKLATLLAAIGDAPLVYSDARIVTIDGTVESDTYWRTRRNNHVDLLSLLVANSVTGAASLMRRELLDDALPFPPGQFSHYHDHWLALVALARDRIEFVPRPLYDYIQHGHASLGHAAANQMPALGDRAVGLWRRSLRDRIRKWRMHYFVDVARLLQFAAVLQMRCGTRMTAEKRRELDRFLRADESLPELAILMGRGLRELVGIPETLGAEWMLFGALVWRRLVSATAREVPQRRGRLDAVPPPDLAPAPVRADGRDSGPGGRGVPPAVRVIEEKVAPLPLVISERVTEPRVNLLIPTVDLAHLFAGYIAKFNLALALARRGHRVRIVTVDPTGPLPRDWAARVESYSGLAGLRREVEFEFGRESVTGLEVGHGDAFIATTWWTAHIARAAQRQLGQERFLYLIQEYEPFTFPMGTYAALAAESYTFSHEALFSTDLLRDYFQAHALGVYAAGGAVGDQLSCVFDNAITDVPPPAAAELAARPGPRRLLFYARPEPHAARNLFELGVLALRRAVAEGHFADGWELSGIGSVARRTGVGGTGAAGGGPRIELGQGLALEVLARSDQRSYAELLRRHDLGLALMYTPHPSLVPLEMASAGMVTVTNRFENKTGDRLMALSANLIVAEPTVESAAAALGTAAARTGDHPARAAAAAATRWPRSWSEAFDDRVLRFVEGALERARGR